MSALREMRVGMSIYWVRLVASGPGWRATWKQHGRDREVWNKGRQNDVLDEAYNFAQMLNSQLDAAEQS